MIVPEASALMVDAMPAKDALVLELLDEEEDAFGAVSVLVGTFQ